MNIVKTLIFFFKVLFKINKIVKFFKPQILHSHLTAMELFGFLIKTFLFKDVKFIITKHLDSYFFEGSFGKRKFFKGVLIEKFILNRAEKVICISNQVKKYFSKILKKDSSKLVVIYYGFSLQSFKFSKNYPQKIHDFKTKYKIKKKDFLICNIARHVKQKSLDLLLLSFSLYYEHNNNSKLILIGNGPLNSYLKNYSKKLGVYQNIIWIDAYENIKDILNISNLFILSSKYEGLGLVLLEAMAVKKPIIATRISAIPEVIKNNYNGLLVKYGDNNEMFKKIKLFEDKKFSVRIGKNGFKFLNKKFNIKKMNFETNKVYINAVQNEN